MNKPNTPKAYIKADPEGSKNLWLMINVGDGSGEYNVAYPLCKDDIEPIMKACVNYLTKPNDKKRVVRKV